MSDKPIRGWCQIHLFTGIVLIFVAGSAFANDAEKLVEQDRDSELDELLALYPKLITKKYKNRHTLLQHAINSFSKKCTKVLIEHGAVENDVGALIDCASIDDVDLLKKLIQAGGD